jgi:subtilisin family serine protease
VKRNDSAIDQDLALYGISQVIVSYTADDLGAKREAMGAVEKCFTSSTLSQMTALAVADGKPSPPKVIHFRHLGVSLGTVNLAGLRALRAESRVAAVSATPVLSLIRPVKKMEASLADVEGELTWGLQLLQAKRIWDAGFTGQGVSVGHLDTGIDGTHPALAGAFAHYAVFDDLGQEESPPPVPPQDTGEHGTHTACTIAGRPVNGTYRGVAPGAQLVSGTVIEGGNTVARVLGGMDWAIANQVRVLSMSLGIRGYVDSWLGITRSLRAQNVLPVFAVGNEGPGTSRSPGNYAEAFAVGAIDKNEKIAEFSSSQGFARQENPSVPDVVAPGVDVLSAKPGGGWQLMSGSSMATPHVAGLAALLFSAKPDATVDDVQSAITQSCQGVPPLAQDRAGHGFPNAWRALGILRG